MLLQLSAKSYVDQLALTPGAASALKSLPQGILIAEASNVFRDNWKKGGAFLVVGAVGAVVRLIAPLLRSKEQDPAVVVIDAKAELIVPLLGGHTAGAESLAFLLAADFDGNVVITSDSNSQGQLALDSFGSPWGWIRSGERTDWNNLLFSQAHGDKLLIAQSSGTEFWKTTLAAQNSVSEVVRNDSSISPHLHIGPDARACCSWHPPTLWIGIGCIYQTSIHLLERAVEEMLSQAKLSSNAVAGIASIDLKGDEIALISLAKAKGWPIRLFTAQELSKVSVPNPSTVVEESVGTPSVAEASALLAAGEGGSLRKSKKIFRAELSEQGAATLAISEAVQAFAPQRGELHLIGSGPGDLAFLTSDARSALARTAVWLGYAPYLDLLEPLRRIDQGRIDGKLTFERERCFQAIQLAKQGVRVALVSSGESGIYGMAGLALEMWLKDLPHERPFFQVHPGISSFQAAAARLGAPLMQDFCSVSLSDRLIPWEKIEQRIEGAAIGDFVVVLYNPRSNQRDWQISRAIEILLEHRPANTPAALARQVGREGEKVQVFTLDTLPVNQIDMFTLVLIGNNCTKFHDGFLVTPRGYKERDKTSPFFEKSG